MKPDWDTYFVKMAHLASTRSTCLRRHVGAVIVKDRMVLSTGYNDTPRGVPNCGDGGCGRCASDVPSGTSHDTCLCIHAEMNCVLQAAYHGVSVAAGTLYCTYLPCLSCAKVLVNVGIRRIVFEGHYPDPLSLELLTRANVEVVRHAPEEIPTRS